MKRHAAGSVVVILLAVLAFTLTAGCKRDRRPVVFKEGDAGPSFTLPALDGKPVDLASFRGKVVMVHFWATWCPPCVEEIPTLQKLYTALPGTDFAVLAVSVDEGGAPAVGAFMRQKGLTLLMLLNPDRSVASSYGTFKFPETYILDRQGIIRYKIIGAADWSRPEPMNAIKELIARK